MNIFFKRIIYAIAAIPFGFVAFILFSLIAPIAILLGKVEIKENKD